MLKNIVMTRYEILFALCLKRVETRPIKTLETTVAEIFIIVNVAILSNGRSFDMPSEKRYAKMFVPTGIKRGTTVTAYLLFVGKNTQKTPSRIMVRYPRKCLIKFH